MRLPVPKSASCSAHFFLEQCTHLVMAASMSVRPCARRSRAADTRRCRWKLLYTAAASGQGRGEVVGNYLGVDLGLWV